MAHPDLDNLLNALVPFAQQMLSKHGEFFPFGSTITTSGEIEAQAAYNGEEQPPSEELIDLLTQAFRQQASAGKIKAAGICYDVRVVPPGKSEKTDAICLALEHQAGDSLNIYLPYAKGWLGRIKFGEMIVEKKDVRFFAAANG